MSRVHPGESHEPKAGGDMTANKDDDKNKSNDVRSSKTTKDDTNENDDVEAESQNETPAVRFATAVIVSHHQFRFLAWKDLV